MTTVTDAANKSRAGSYPSRELQLVRSSQGKYCNGGHQHATKWYSARVSLQVNILAATWTRPRSKQRVSELSSSNCTRTLLPPIVEFGFSRHSCNCRQKLVVILLGCQTWRVPMSHHQDGLFMMPHLPLKAVMQSRSTLLLSLKPRTLIL